MIKKLLATILIFLIMCGNSFAVVVGYNRTFGGGGVTCSGTFPTDPENFEAVADGDFCTTGLTEVDTNSILTTNSTEQAASGSKSMKIAMGGVGQLAYVGHDITTPDGDWSVSFAWRTPASPPAVQLGIFQAATTGINSGDRLNIYYKSGGFFSAFSTNTATSDVAAADSTFYIIEVDYNRNATGTLAVYANNNGAKGTQLGTTQNFTCRDDDTRFYFNGQTSAAASTSTFYVDVYDLNLLGL